MGAIGRVEEVDKALLSVAPHVRKGLQRYQGHRSLQNACRSYVLAPLRTCVQVLVEPAAEELMVIPFASHALTAAAREENNRSDRAIFLR